MRQDNQQFAIANQAPGKSPRFVVAIIFEVGSLYITSHDDIPNVPGVVFEGMLERPSGISQRIIPDDGRTEIGTFSFSIVDVGSAFTDEVRAKLTAGASLRGKSVRLYVGYRGFDFSAFQLFQTQVISGVEYDDGVYSISCRDITRLQQLNVFDVKSTNLLSSCTVSDTTINVADTSQFFSVQHGAFWNDGPNLACYYFRIEDEVIRATGKTATSFTGCTRGVMNTVAAPHVADPAAAVERRPKVTEFVYLDLPAPKVALAVMTGGIFHGWPANLTGTEGSFQTDSNADGVANGWILYTADGGRVQTASIIGGPPPTAGNLQRLAITTSTNTGLGSVFYKDIPFRAGLTITLSVLLRTNVAGAVGAYLQFHDATGAVIEAPSSTPTVAGDSAWHLEQVSATAPSRTEFVRLHVGGISTSGSFFEVDSVMAEIGSVSHAFTTTPCYVLPTHWHCGMDPAFVRFADFTGIGRDLWDTADDGSGFPVRFEGITKQDGKRFIEKELYLLMGCYSPIYSDGTLGLRRLPAMVSDAAPVATLSERDVISISPLQHDYDSLHNLITVNWGYDLGLGDFTRETVFIDQISLDIHGEAPPKEYSFRGLHSGTHTEAMIRLRIDAIRDAYSYPPQRTTVTVLPGLNYFEEGDVLRLNVRNVRDFAGNTSSIDRSFVCLRRSIDFATGDVQFELMGSTLRPEALAPSTGATAPLPDAFYNATGVALSSVVPMTGNTVNAGTHTINGTTDMNASGSVFYHLGDLVIPDGATIVINGNVQLRVRGFLTLNGDIDGAGNGHAGVSDPGPALPLLTQPIAGTPGFIGHSRGWDGVAVPLFARGAAHLRTIPVAIARGAYDAWPALNLQVDGNTLLGIPTDFRGAGGPPGGRAHRGYNGFATVGGPGAAGGAGLAVICRGMSFGVSSSINLDGDASVAQAAVAIGGGNIYPGSGGGGGPGACLILLDGNSLLVPNASGRFFARAGVVPVPGLPIPARDIIISGSEWLELFPDGGFGSAELSGFADEQAISGLDFSNAALRIQYVPSTQTPTSDQNRLPAPPTSLTVTGADGYNAVRVGMPPLGTFDVVDIYAAITNDRTGATLVSRGRAGYFDHSLPALATRYYWARTVRLSETGLELASDFFPVSATAGVVGTTLNPGGWTPIVTAAGGATMIATANTLEKSGGVLDWDSQAYSIERFAGCTLSFRAASATANFMIGLNTDPILDASYLSLDHAWFCASTGALQIRENGFDMGYSLTYDASTVLSITYDGENVRYYRDGVLIRTVFRVGSLFNLDSSFYTPGAKALDVRFQPANVVPKSFGTILHVNMNHIGRHMFRVTGGGWDSGVSSIEGFAQGAYASARALNTSSNIMFGLNSDPTTDHGFATIDYAWYFTTASALIQIYESGSLAYQHPTPYTTSTVLAVAHVGSSIVYYVDGVAVRSVLRNSTAPLYFDSSFNDNNGALVDVEFGPQSRADEVSGTAVFLETFERNWEERWANVGNDASVVVTYPNNGQFGGRVLRAQRMIWIASNDNVPFDPSALYRISGRIRRTAASGSGNEFVYIGVEGVGTDGVTFINQAGANSRTSQHYNCASAFDMSGVAVGTWRDFVGWFRGHTTTNFGVAANNDSPTGLRTGVAFFRPMCILNYNGGTGTMEIDYIKVERLTSPDDADNSAKNRIVPDTEFERATDQTYWWFQSVGTPAISISNTGGQVAGYVSLTCNGLLNSHHILSRRRQPYQCVNRELYTITIRAQMLAGTFNGILFAGVARHATDGSSSSVPIPHYDCLGGLFLSNDPSSLYQGLDTTWREYSAICFLPVPPTGVGGDFPFLSAKVGVQLGSVGTVLVDMVQVTPGVAIDPPRVVLTASQNYGTATSEYFKLTAYNSGSPGTFTLPSANSRYVGAKMFFEQIGTGALTIATQVGDTMYSQPNSTANRQLSGRYARVQAEVIEGPAWLLTGDLL